MQPDAEMFADLLALVGRFGLAFDPQLAAVFRALGTLEGTLLVLDPSFPLVDEARKLASTVGRSAFGPLALSRAARDELLRLEPVLRRLPRRVDRITEAMERNEWGINVRLLADDRDVAFVTRLADRALIAFFSAAIGIVSALLLAAGGGPVLGDTLPLNELLGYVGLTVATILGLRVTVAISRDRVV